METTGASPAERLRVYHLALRLNDQVHELIELSGCSPSRADQVRRAADSVVLNIAEGAAQFSPGQKIRYYQIAYGSTAECLAAIELLRRGNPRLLVQPPRFNAKMVQAMLVSLIEHQELRRAAK
ncbi:hypothetical protein BH23GEM10_BH23GEM10_02770 [soil metagenome]